MILDAGDLLESEGVLHGNRELRGDLLQQSNSSDVNAAGSALATFNVPRLPRR